MSETPLELVDFEFGFLDGRSPLYVTAQMGRDEAIEEPTLVRIVLRPDPDHEDEYTIYRLSLAYLRRTQRTEQPEPKKPEWAKAL